MINFEGGYDNEFRDVSNRKGLEDLFGICSCMYLNYCITKFGKVFSSCSIFKISLIGGDRMTDCTSYNKNGQMTLNEMKEIAYLIEVDTRKIGLLK